MFVFKDQCAELRYGNQPSFIPALKVDVGGVLSCGSFIKSDFLSVCQKAK